MPISHFRSWYRSSAESCRKSKRRQEARKLQEVLVQDVKAESGAAQLTNGRKGEQASMHRVCCLVPALVTVLNRYTLVQHLTRPYNTSTLAQASAYSTVPKLCRNKSREELYSPLTSVPSVLFTWKGPRNRCHQDPLYHIGRLITFATKMSTYRGEK